ncbi:MAG: NADH-quinone oxidoreductase subunit M [Candidatus Carbobacillus altaicus]|nr:NADH-quinone oxidoreductase subunit M [Candidatus Carbobacillus altaicus]
MAWAQIVPNLVVLLPVVGLVIVLFIPSRQGGTIRLIGQLVSLVVLLLVGILYSNFNVISPEGQFSSHFTWFELSFPGFDPATQTFVTQSIPVAWSISIDGISLALLMMTALIIFVATLASGYEVRRLKTYMLFLFLLEIGAYGVFMTENLVWFFIFFEFTLISLYFLVGQYGGFARESAANAYLLYNGLGSLLMLIAFVVLFHATGSWDMVVIRETLASRPLSHSEARFVFFLLLIGFGIKLPIFPLHRWMLQVHREASPAVVMIHSGVLLKMGAYGLIRFAIGFFPDIAHEYAWLIALLGLINLLYGAFLAFVQDELRLVFAYSSLSHMGIVLFGLAALNQIGLQGAVFQMVSHGLISALLFYILGSIERRMQTSSLKALGGLSAAMPVLSGTLMFATMANLGLPALSGFISEFQAFLGLFQSDRWLYAALGLIALVLTALYMLRATLSLTYGPLKVPDMREGQGALELDDVRPQEVMPLVLLASAIILIGVYPNVLATPLGATLGDFVARMGGF